MSSTLESLHLVGETIRDVWAEFMDYFDAAKIAGKLYSEKVIDYSVMEIIKKAKSKKDANGAFLEHLNSNATVESLKTLCELLRATSGNCPRHACLAKLLDEKLTRKVPQSSMCVAAPDLSTGTSHKDTFLAKDPPHRRLEAMFSRLPARLARIFDKHIEALKPILRARQKREEWPCNLLEVEDIDDAKNILTIFNKIRIEDCWLNTELLIRLIEALPDEESCRDEAQQHLEQYHEFLNGFCKSVLLKEIPSDDAYLKHFRSRPLAIIVNVTFDVNLGKFYFSNLLKQQEFLSRMFKIPIEAFHYLEAKTTESTLVTWALDISIKETVYLLQRAADAFWSLKEYSIIKVEIADVGVLYLRGKDLPKLIKKALQGNQDFFSCTEHVSHQFLALVDYHHLKRSDTEEYRHSMLLQLPLPKQLLQDSVSLNVVEPGVEQEQTGPTLTAPSGPTLTAPTGPTLTAPSGPALTTPTDPALTTPTDPALTTPSGPTLTAPTDPTLTTPTGPALTTPTGPALTTPTGPTLTTPTGPALTTPTGPALTTPTGSPLTTPTGPTLTTPTGPALTTPTGSPLTTPTGPTLTTPTGPALTTPTGPALTTPTGSPLTTPTGPTLTTPTGSPLTTPTGPALTTPTGPALTTPTGPALTTPTGPTLTTPTGPALTTPTGPTLTTPTGPTLTTPTGPALTTPTGPALTTPTGPALTTPTGPTLTTPTGPIQTINFVPTKTTPTCLIPLMLAASGGNNEIVASLLHAVANVHQLDSDGRTALHHACMFGHLEVVRTLMNKEPSLVNQGDEVEHTPLMLAASQGYHEVVNFLTTICMPVTMVHKKSKNRQTALHLACLAGHLEVVGTLLDAGAIIDECDESGLTPLMLAASEGHDEVVIHLVSAGANVFSQDNDGRTALHHACVSGHLEVVYTLMDEEPSLVNQGDEVEHTPLMLAASQGHYDIVKILTTMPETMIHEKSKRQQTALHWACLAGHLEVVGTMLGPNANIDECDESGLTPLMLAASKGHDEVVIHLVSAGANVFSQDNDGRTALHHACVSGHLDVVYTLMDEEPSLVNQGDEVEHTPLMLAASQGHHEVVDFLASMPITKVHKMSSNRQTAILLAYFGRHLKVVGTLLNANANIDECDESGHTSLMLAASEGHDWIVTRLLSAGANVFSQDNDGRTALHHACVSGHLEVVRTLMNKEPSLVNQGDEVEHTPLMLAASQGHHKVVDFLASMPITKVHKMSSNRQTAIFLAYFGRHLKVVGTLLNANANIDECDESGHTSLMLAASEGHDWIVTRLLSAGANVFSQDSNGRTALHHACVSGHLGVVCTLMNKEPSLVNQGDEVEHTPLMLAASQGNHEVVNFLTTMPVTMVHKKSKNRQTALHLAYLAWHFKVADTLLHAGAIIDECDESGLTPIMLAASEGHDKIVNRLLCADANLGKQCNADGKTALHYAAEQGAMLSVNELLLSGASIDLKDVYGHTPLTIATIKRQYDVAIQLIQTGADITHLTRHEGRDLAEEVLSFAIQANLTRNNNCQNFCALFQQDSGVNLQNWNTYKHSVATLILGQLRTGGFKHPTLLATDPPMTELMWSTHKGYDSLVKYLILQGVDVNAQNVQGNTALHFAAQDNHIQCGLLLAKAGANVRATNKQSQVPFDVSTAEFRNGLLEMLSFQTKKICCVLGNALTGKSTLIASLQNENANVFTKVRNWLFGVGNISQRTAGIEPVSLSSKRYGNVLFYDFAGQHEYHGPHELFLESIITRELSSVAVVAVVNITEKQSGMFQQLNRWLQPFYKLPSTTNPIPVILVGSHLDKAKRQDEAKHNLYMCCEQLKSQGDSVLQFDSICCLDCRQPYAPDINKLCKYLQDVPLPQCEDSHTGYSLPWVISLIRSSFTEKVVPLSRFADLIYKNKANLPTNLPPAEDVCRDLASTGHFLYLPSKKALSEGWLVLDLPSILKEVYGILFSSGKSKVNKFGLLSCAHLPALFPRFEPSLVRSILVSLGFGVEVDPSVLSEATHLIESSDREHKYLFIPALVTASQPNVFANTSGSAHMFCWQFEVDEKLFLSPRILQAVILQLASHHVFPHKQGSKVEPLACSVWLNGIFWKSRRDADVAVQISDNTAIHVIGCSEVSAEALCRYMSTVVQDIARTIKSIDASMHGSAYIVCPQPANLQFLLENPRPPAHQKFPIDVMLDSIRDGSVTTTSLDSPSSTWQRKMSLSELFGGFKPSMEAVKGFLVLQDSTAQPTDPSSGLTTTTGPTQTPHNDPLMSMPNMEILDNLVVQKIASNWHRVCIHLGIPPEVQKAIQANHPSDVEQCCHNMFIRWLSPKLGSGAKPRTWESILIALQKADYPHVAEDVRREITGHTAIISSSSVVTPNEDILTAPSDSLLTTFTGLTLTTPTGSYLTTPTSLLLPLPNIETLDLFGVYEVAARWQKVGVHLGMTSEALQIIQANHPSNVVQCCHDMFDRWLFSRKGTGEKPRTWEIVLSALENANYSNVAADLRRELDPAS